MEHDTVGHITEVIAYIESHLNEKLDLDTVAQAVHYSKYHLHRMFTETTGLTLHDYIRRRQLTEAAKLLVFSGQPVLQVALAAAVTTFLFNITMMDLAGEDGVAAVTIMIYAQFLLNTLYIGYSMGVAPVIGFYYGNQNGVRQEKVIRISIGFVMAASVLLCMTSGLGGSYIVCLFAPGTSEVYRLAAAEGIMFLVSAGALFLHREKRRLS